MPVDLADEFGPQLRSEHVPHPVDQHEPAVLDGLGDLPAVYTEPEALAILDTQLSQILDS